MELTSSGSQACQGFFRGCDAQIRDIRFARGSRDTHATLTLVYSLTYSLALSLAYTLALTEMVRTNRVDLTSDQ